MFNRIPSPQDFRLIGAARLTIATLDTFSQTGFEQALIQKKDSIKSYLDSAWTIQILRGIIYDIEEKLIRIRMFCEISWIPIAKRNSNLIRNYKK